MMPLSPSLLDSSRMGLIVLTPDRKVDTCLGTLVSWCSENSHAMAVMPFLTGLDDVLDDIVSGRRASFILPRMALPDGALAGKVVSLEIMPTAPAGRLQILVRDETEFANLEQNIVQQRNQLALTNEALEEAKSRAEAALKEKAAFLANISHDLKTPLQVIMGNAEILRGELPDEERDGFLQDVLDNSNFLLALINDLLDAAALETEQLRLTEEVVDIRALLEKIVTMARQMPKGGRRRFVLNLDRDDRAVLADPMRLQRLLINVVGNAVKFTEDGGSIALKAGANDGGEILIEVEDDGCGIEPALMPRLFEPFVMGNHGEGTGLGLHIAKRLADLHEADFSLASTPALGTTARLRFPKSRFVVPPR